MTTAPDSLRVWLRQQITQTLTKRGAKSSFLIWCDPQRVWRELLLATAEDNAFEVWAEESHELVLRERFYAAPQAPRVIWLPVAREDISYFKVFTLEAVDVRQWTLAEALAAYGVEISSEQLVELNSLLAAHVKEWLDRSKSAWKELTPGNAKSTLVDDERVFDVLASSEAAFEAVLPRDRFPVFVRRVTEDFGLPTPHADDPQTWRLQAVATLLCTDAATKCPDTPPSERDRMIPAGTSRTPALQLLARWQKHVDLCDGFEELALRADTLTTLQYWAKNLPDIPAPLASPAAENALFQVEVERLTKIDEFAILARHLDEHVSVYHDHARSFWGQRARTPVRWGHLAKLASIASLLYQQAQVEAGWKTPADAMDWYVSIGWQVDHAGEALFQEDAHLPGGLMKVRAILRKAYLRHLDRMNAAFSELLSHSTLASLALPFAGDAIKELVGKASAREPVAILVLDACRYDLGCRLAEMLNRGEPTRRATVTPARAPIPSITALGMPLCLPGASETLRVSLTADTNADWHVTVAGFAGDLSQANQRRAWLKQTYKLKDSSLLSISDILNSDVPDAITAKALGKLIFVFGDDFDDHDGVLKPFGLDQIVERYATAIRRLRSGGYNSICVVTDHGFFHWEPEQDEIEPKPTGDVRWSSRRATVGHGLQHSSAISLQVTASDLDCRVPRSINAFKTYGSLGFFHGGATLQELVIPVVLASWPKKAKRIDVVLKPLEQIVSLSQRVEVAPAASAQKDIFGSVDTNLLGRQVMIKVLHPDSGKLLFKSKGKVTVEPGGGTVTVELEKVKGTEATVGTEVQLLVLDADDEEILDRSVATLKVELDEWF
ncbi:MAG: PglZ domain-containing protein [Candidatus Binatia bacterium]